MHRLLISAYDLEGWWPTTDTFEVMVGAMLTQQASWERVIVAMARMSDAGLLAPKTLAATAPAELTPMLKAVGFMRTKSERLVSMARYLVDMYDGDPEAMLKGDLDEVRQRLLALNGVGPETADSILLFGAGRPKFVAAAYTSRVLWRTGVYLSRDYEAIQQFVEGCRPGETIFYRELYAGTVELAKGPCRRNPRCDECPLGSECPMIIGV